jgi:hypothetical protein
VSGLEQQVVDGEAVEPIADFAHQLGRPKAPEKTLARSRCT